MVHQLLHHLQDGRQQARGQGLNFIQDDNALGQVMELAAGCRPVSKETFKKLDRGSNYNGRIPVLRCQPGPLLLDEVIFIFTRGYGTVMLQDVLIAKYPPVNLGCLVDDAGIRDGDDNSVLLDTGVSQGKGHTGKGLAAPGGDGEPEKSRFLRSGGVTML